jgi:hypothetical protein
LVCGASFAVGRYLYVLGQSTILSQRAKENNLKALIVLVQLRLPVRLGLRLMGVFRVTPRPNRVSFDSPRAGVGGAVDRPRLSGALCETRAAAWSKCGP